jgi:hypothetical protein
MKRSNADNIGSCVEHRSHLALDPKPMYVDNEFGHKAYRDMGHLMKQKRIGSMCHVDDVSNKSGMRAKGGY